jgi:DNA-binding NarL/FixJ family response regulator
MNLRYEIFNIEAIPRSTAMKPKSAQSFRLFLKGGRVKKITVLLADDYAVVRLSLCRLLRIGGHFNVVQARNGREAVEMAARLRPDVILIDIAMAVLNGLHATRQILAADPAAKVIILSAHPDDEYIECMTTVGVAGILEKHTAAEILHQAIYEVVNGHRFFSPAIAKRMTRSKAERRNQEVRAPAARGRQPKERK